MRLPPVDLPLTAGLAVGIALAAGCGAGPDVATLAGPDLSRVSAVRVTDVAAFDARRRGAARPTRFLDDPDSLLRIQRAVDGLAGRWRPVRGRPRSSRIEATLLADGRGVLTVWVEPGYVQASTGGKDLRGCRLSGEETAAFAAALGLAPADLAPLPKLPDARGPRPKTASR